MTFQMIESIDSIAKVLHANPVVVIFKHSATCPVSTAANKEVEFFMQEHPAIPVFRVTVQNQRDISDAFTSRSGIRHESPQVLTYVDGKLSSHTSHWHITADWLSECIQATNK
jgi:bacillithiol system protein YtxJ